MHARHARPPKMGIYCCRTRDAELPALFSRTMPTAKVVPIKPRAHGRTEHASELIERKKHEKEKITRCLPVMHKCVACNRWLLP